jgi:hypothetical protein
MGRVWKSQSGLDKRKDGKDGKVGKGGKEKNSGKKKSVSQPFSFPSFPVLPLLLDPIPLHRLTSPAHLGGFLE